MDILVLIKSLPFFQHGPTNTGADKHRKRFVSFLPGSFADFIRIDDSQESVIGHLLLHFDFWSTIPVLDVNAPTNIHRYSLSAEITAS
jgi:hypothetical protein